MSMTFTSFLGVPSFRPAAGQGHFYLKNYAAAITGNLGLYYHTKSNWQFGLLTSIEVYFLNPEKAEKAVIVAYGQPGLLHTVTVGSDPFTVNLRIEAGKTFQFRNISITPFIQPGLVYLAVTGASQNFSLQQKMKDEHYYKKTEWEFSGGEIAVRALPLSLATGVRFTAAVDEIASFYVAPQYLTSTIVFDAVRRETDFNGLNEAQKTQFRQQYNLPGVELGLQIWLNRIGHASENF